MKCFILKFQNDLGACKVFIKTLNVGNKIVRVRFVVSSVLGLIPGCDIDAPRIYLPGIYLLIEIYQEFEMNQEEFLY
ncbi:MAG: hypothetical protein EZS28_025735 [Streblomastix strix]|uniref:Uncharacterized protein n=1 Tax=Streblomastix strix TaxID=222440 RepID=A0A5J4V8C0_9EUKA|nr:MAG: hypothetical protein EZS28_025735 [Streblomastix strix]